MPRLAGDSSHYTVALLDAKGKPTEHTFQIPSVTHILDVVAKPALYRWYFTEGIRGVSEVLQRYGTKTPSDVKSLMSLLSKHELGPYAVRDAKAALGKKIHRELEKLCRGEPVKATTQNAGIRSWITTEGLLSSTNAVVATEKPLVSFRYCIAGTPDLVYQDQGDNEVVLADLKTGSTVPITAYFQIAAYKLMWEECGLGKIDRTEIIHCPVGKPGTYKVLSRPDITEEHFLAVLAMYRKLEGENL